MLDSYDKLYYFLASTRILLTCIPQTGYIHPDEYFQSIEVLAGDVFNIQTNRPWDYNATFPIRSVLVPYLTVGIPYELLKTLDTYCNLKTPYCDLKTPYCDLKTPYCDLKTPYWLLVFPRLFICLASFLIDYCLYKTCVFNNVGYKKKLVVLASSYVTLIFCTRTFSNAAETIAIAIIIYLVSRVRARNNFPLKHGFIISLLAIVGSFNRPTFAAFALPPVAYWLIGIARYRLCNLFINSLILMVWCIGLISGLVIVDSLYYGYVSIADLYKLDVSYDNFVLTPYNFVKYNLDLNKLSEHGLHPRFLHVIVNIPLLYNILGVTALWRIFLRINRRQGLDTLMLLSIILPVVIISYVPHQEPRYIIPITFPLIYLYSDIILSKNCYIKIWVSANVACVLFYGFVHQGGIYPLISYISSRNIHLVTSHTYSMPVSLLNINGECAVTEMGSRPLNEVFAKIDSMADDHKGQNKSEIYLIIPSSKRFEIDELSRSENVSLKLVKTFYPHVSVEAFPRIQTVFDHNNMAVSVVGIISDFIESCGLNLYHKY